MYVLTECSAGEFRCDNGQCVIVRSVCEGYSYCVDRSDQANCSKCRIHCVELLIGSFRNLEERGSHGCILPCHKSVIFHDDIFVLHLIISSAGEIGLLFN